ncbi:YbaN family protein [Suttonella sp. R2A3]|uniref:YbaN family protein n=1 Tax=Suttonella sp. R2A3 TaxID=2908648 RepID=UPI001F21B2CD|nr:YbaN family protein [Suttonella sp. R2A3]UJF24821.1 YbaN family protein [Suttonella sp. R2A3]
MKYLWFIAGVIAFILGLVGVFLPVFPTVPFIIAAAFCFARSSPRFHQYLLTHPVFGPSIVAWEERRAIPRTGKWAATIMLSISLPISSWLLGAQLWWASALVIVVCILVMWWIWLRPDS